MAIKYNFNKIKADSPDRPDDPRKGIRMIQSCSNCKHYWYLFSSPRNGMCRLPNPTATLKRDLVATLDKEATDALGWLPTHSTLTCDGWEPSALALNKKKIMKFTGLTFTYTGELADEELQETEVGKICAKSQ